MNVKFVFAFDVIFMEYWSLELEVASTTETIFFQLFKLKGF